jgi:hypothetical protein
MRGAISIAAFVLASLACRSALADGPAPTPADTPAFPYVRAGIPILGLPYAFGLISATSPGAGSARWLWVPVVGPFADLATRGGCTPSPTPPDGGGGGGGRCSIENSTAHALGTVFLGIDGALQVAGAVMIVYGLAAPDRPARRPEPAWSLRPTGFGKNVGGLVLAGTF